MANTIGFPPPNFADTSKKPDNILVDAKTKCKFQFWCDGCSDALSFGMHVKTPSLKSKNYPQRQFFCFTTLTAKSVFLRDLITGSDQYPVIPSRHQFSSIVSPTLVNLGVRDLESNTNCIPVKFIFKHPFKG